ncbi:hypothetical protein EBE87_25935 [Pseudoroseomonas wenyumeiae]|uniref:Uncharacterized protein n=1 Tax=Teichococcus wenyumeiae TaxID=2478470 RepID=A0A3A9JF47_9PROT|nr:hypothetical protein [Pseudoroseomonas wenyumeiae]RKK03313.1 hypothetical protein D6Z83_15245 [Pseudoroseomonas wenyumeiae]RMI15419.1 hypothetical protein EBE87_25935 [Pseudoroseomonas wenyumeiae]
MSVSDTMPKASEDHLPLSRVPRELAAIASGGPVEYHHVYKQVLNGNLPADNIRNRWYVLKSDLPAIAAAFGMTLRQTLSEPTRRQRRTMQPVARGQQVAA